MDFDNAEKQFAENLRLFGNANREPEKFNLYAGLINLAKGLQSLGAEIAEIKRLSR
jgi:hypothetical protein